jgi:hypothetical protein
VSDTVDVSSIILALGMARGVLDSALIMLGHLCRAPAGSIHLTLMEARKEMEHLEARRTELDKMIERALPSR